MTAAQPGKATPAFASTARHLSGSLLLAIALPALAAAQYTRISVAAGGGQPNGRHGGGVINAGGTHVAFASEASNLVDGDTNGCADVFVRDIQAGTTSRISVAADGSERQGASGAPDISNDGRFVVFTSRAALVAGDTQACLLPGEIAPVNCQDIYLRDRQVSQTIRISVPAGGGQGNGWSDTPRISGDGRWIVFSSEASNLAPDDTNGVSDIFLFDRRTGTLSRVNLSTGGTQADLASSSPSLSDDGQTIAFVSASTTLSAEPDTVVCERAPPACERPFLHDRASGATRRIVMPAFQTRFELPIPPFTINYRVTTPSLDVAPDGRTVAVNAYFEGIRTISTRIATADPWVFDRDLDRVTVSFPVSAPTLALSGSYTTAWDGRRMTLVTGPVGLLDTTNGLFEQVAGGANITSWIGNLDAGGRYLLFGTSEPKTPDDTDTALDVYLLDRDPDADGMPSAWETRFGLDPANGADDGADPDLDGASNAVEYAEGGHPTGGIHAYLAEGAANAFFTTRLAILNPSETSVLGVVGQHGENQRRWSQIVTLPARSRRTLWLPGTFDWSFSTVVESNEPLVVDRTMTWDARRYGSHAETAVAAPATAWFLAEGATHGQFQLFYLLQNPGRAPANVTVTYLRPAPAPPVTRQYAVAPDSRLTIWVDNDSELAATDVSARIVSDRPILVERAMYMDVADPPQPFGAGHAGAGVTAAAPRWFLAEGATGNFFDLYYLIANPSPQATRIRVTYLLPAGAPLVREYDVPRESRLTISVDTEDPLLDNTPVSAVVESLDGVGIVVERSMWWPGQGRWQEAHLAAGSTATARRWALAEGEVSDSTETYVLIANTSGVMGNATLSIVPELGAIDVQTVALPPRSRVSVAMSQYAATRDRRFGIIVDSDGPDIVVERAMYANANGIVWAAGTAALASRIP